MNTSDTVIRVEKLSLYYEQNNKYKPVLNNISFSIVSGEAVALLGESGSGKSTIAKAIGGLLPSSACVTEGEMCINGITIPLNARPKLWDNLRGRTIGFVFQDAHLALDPTRKISDIFKETLCRHHLCKRNEVYAISVKYLSYLNFHDPNSILDSYSFQLSGGMCQRVCIALALCLEPKILIADEPTSALDVISQREVLELLKRIQSELKLAVLLITHDISVAAAVSHRMIVLNQGEIVDEGNTEALLHKPDNPYTKQLISARMPLLQTNISERKYGESVLQANRIKKRFSNKEVLEGVSFQIHQGEIFGILGESGCGKSTLAKCLIGLENIDSGELLFRDKSLVHMSRKERKDKCRKIQIIFQDARACLNPRFTAAALVQEPLNYLKLGNRKERRALAEEYLKLVGIEGDAQLRRPPQLSTGQCQRVAIARAIIGQPQILICDEAVSALDMTVQTQILELLLSLHSEFHFSLIMITHDIQIIRHFCHTVAVMKDGGFCETMKVSELDNSQNAYTQTLLDCERKALFDLQRR